VSKNIAFLELKYGNINGGYPNFYAISEIALLVFEQDTKRIFLETWTNNTNVDIVNVYAKVDSLGHTIGRVKEIFNMKTRRRRPYQEDFQLGEDDLQKAFDELRPSKNWIRSFLRKVLTKYRFRDMVVFDGRRDVFLCEKSGANFDRINVIDIQKDLNKETEYLFSLNKLSVVSGFDYDSSYVRSNNLEYWLHPIAARQILPKSAAFDAVRLLMVYNEFTEHHDDFMMKAALLLNKIQNNKNKE